MSPRSCLYYVWFLSYKTHKNYHVLVLLLMPCYTYPSIIYPGQFRLSSARFKYTHFHKTQSSRPKISRGIVLEGSWSSIPLASLFTGGYRPGQGVNVYISMSAVFVDTTFKTWIQNGKVLLFLPVSLTPIIAWHQFDIKVPDCEGSFLNLSLAET